MQPHPGPQHSTGNITTEQVEKYLDENKQLIIAIMENQNLGKLAESAQYQNQLQKNLLYLAAIADAQPHAPTTVRPQIMMPHVAMPQGGQYKHQGPVFPRPLFNPLQVQEQQPQQHLLHHQSQVVPLQGHMSMRPGFVNGMHFMNAEASRGDWGGKDLPQRQSASKFPSGKPSSSVDGRRNKQDAGGAASDSAANGNKNSAAEHGSQDAE